MLLGPLRLTLSQSFLPRQPAYLHRFLLDYSRLIDMTIPSRMHRLNSADIVRAPDDEIVDDSEPERQERREFEKKKRRQRREKRADEGTKDADIIQLSDRHREIAPTRKPIQLIEPHSVIVISGI